MSMSKPVILTVLTAFAFSAPALAQDDGRMILVQPDGTVTTMDPSKMSPDASKMMMENGQEMSGGMIIMMDGQMFMMEDKKIKDGKMTSDTMMMQQQ